MKNSKLVTLGILGLVVAVAVGLVAFIGHTHKQQATAASQSAIVEVTKDNLDKEVKQSQLPVVIIFYAPNCKPCDDEMQLLNQAAFQYVGRAKFVKIDAAANPEIAQSNGITKVPTLFVIKIQDKTVLYNVGYMDKDELQKFIDAGIAMKP